MALLLAFLGDVSPKHSSSISTGNLILLLVLGILVVLIALGVVLAVRRRGRR